MSKDQEIMKALSDVKTKLTEEDLKRFLESFGGAKIFIIEGKEHLRLNEKYYDDFLHSSLMIMRYGAIAFLNTRQL